ncbi:MAG TPA: hypothetical protein PKJ68_06370 [Candidatus Woesebacteria bacterium]|nr:hypothetical protein [Candidatus Woesebacteria bacterium]
MSKQSHPILTKDFPENLNGGFMICGINFGWSREDEMRETRGEPEIPEPLSFFSDKSVNNTKFRNRVLKWLSSWGFSFAEAPDQAKAFDRSFFQTNWLDSQTRSINSDGPININVLVEHSSGILNVLKERKPSVIFFFSHMLIEALNDIRIRNEVESILGERSGNAKAHFSIASNSVGKKFKLMHQKYGETQIISLPHPSARGISDDYIAALKPPIHVIHKLIERSI